MHAEWPLGRVLYHFDCLNLIKKPAQGIATLLCFSKAEQIFEDKVNSPRQRQLD